MVRLKEYLLEIINNYNTEKEKNFGGNYLASYIRQMARKAIPESIIDSKEYLVKASAGQSNWAAVPWLAIFDRDISETAQAGYDLVFLFNVEMNGVYLSLNQGYTYFETKYKGQERELMLEKVSNYWASRLNFINDKNVSGFTLNPIDLGSNKLTNSAKRLPRGYEKCNIYSKYYSKETLESLSEAEMYKDLQHMKIILLELKTLLYGSFEQMNDHIINDCSTEQIKQEVNNKNNETQNSTLGEHVEIPTTLKLPNYSKTTNKVSKRDHIIELDRNIKQGRITEELVFKNEFARLKSEVRAFSKEKNLSNKDLENLIVKLNLICNQIRHLSVDEGDGLGYDIKSFSFDKESLCFVDRYIEVKSTSSGINTPFYFSINEYLTAKEEAEKYFIYRLYKDGNKWNYYIINDPINKNETTPVSFLAIPK